MKNALLDCSLIFGLGGSLYCLLETLWRGHTHWTMGLTGGACLLVIFYLFPHISSLPLILQALGCTAVITGFEFSVGCVVNLLLHWNVWDYSALSFNLMGQVSLLFSCLWFALSFPILALCRLLHYFL